MATKTCTHSSMPSSSEPDELITMMSVDISNTLVELQSSSRLKLGDRTAGLKSCSKPGDRTAELQNSSRETQARRQDSGVRSGSER